MFQNIEKYFEQDYNEDTAYLNLQDTAKEYLEVN